MSRSMSRLAGFAVIVSSAACALPPTIEAHEAAAELRADPRMIGSVSRQELESDVTDPASIVGSPSKPAPVPGTMTVSIVGMVSSKLCFRVDETGGDRNDFTWRMNNAAWSTRALPARALSSPVPWPNPIPAMVKVLDAEKSPQGTDSAVVCLTAPRFADDTRSIAFTMSWDSRKRKLALFQLTE